MDWIIFVRFKKTSRTDPGWSPSVWKQFAELGLMAAPLPEEHGGLGGGPLDTMIVMEEFGRALVIEPYVPTVVIGGGFLMQGGSAALQEEFLPKIASGESMMAFAFAEPKGRYNLAELATTAKKQGSGYVLNGHKSVVLGGPLADQLIVTARTGGSGREEKGISVFLVDKKSNGVSSRDFPTVDGLRASDEMLHLLIEGLERRRCDALLGFYGDHLPSLPETFRALGFDRGDTDYRRHQRQVSLRRRAHALLRRVLELTGLIALLITTGRLLRILLGVLWLPLRLIRRLTILRLASVSRRSVTGLLRTEGGNA